ncbi:translocase inner membrane component YidC [Ameyamaea chiangmaiensis NBRC 103196]|uniref:Membrane protein insertase YidC n=1 Tax=Ameyamaea chiangmaiensis TaxID=442969 RepID=A0A850P9P3_9PROT|nr:membrane protein insertase YidC [Ameyamaea chiangmaiensis]MBS4074431.1 membrane protein insertase YidC [Ameyamaea chiangmaiensis]NVN40754.1 membrane protein insertase YidC [Ameyamaea chiangmaiensis]GBQ72015.1 translocase inner membrane component YidC [Ameyamaea chiangmaiensis NBRC 103196]
MDIRRFLLATILSAVVLLGFDYFMPQKAHQDAPKPVPVADRQNPAPVASAPSAPRDDVRLPLGGGAVSGSINLRGARLDDLTLRDYRETVAKDSPNVRLLEPQGKTEANYVEIGWLNAPGGQTMVPGADTLWTADGSRLAVETPLTLHWDNGQGVTFRITLRLDRNYMFAVEQSVDNHSGQALSLYPFARVERGYTPEVTGGYLVQEGPVSVIDGRLTEGSYKTVRKDSAAPLNQSWSRQGSKGWVGITDKYWLTAVIPDQSAPIAASYGFSGGTYQAGFVANAPLTVAAGASATTSSHIFAGAKEVRLLEAYEKSLHIDGFWRAVDFGWFAFLTRPIFFVLDWLNTLLGNFGLALMAFTLIVKALFFPLASKSFKSMAGMRTLQPKMQALRERHKDDPVAMNQAIMGLYKSEKINPASGCLPMLVQIPVFWCLYKDLYVTIEMRHAPFFGWIRDLSAADPTNLFTAFGLIPWDPTVLTPMLHMGIWPIVLGGTMFLMQKLNPTPMADPAQARVFQFMPVIFAFIMARQPAGLVIYYCWNNLLTALQQRFIQHRSERARATPALPARSRK